MKIPRQPLEIVNISKSFGEKALFESFSADVSPGEKVGVVGGNGTGKTTLLKILAGLEEASSGTVKLSPEASVGYLPQTMMLEKEKSIWEVATEGVHQTLQALAQLDKMNTGYAEKYGEEGFPDEYARLQDLVEAGDGYQLTTQVEQMLSAMGLDKDFQGTSISELSGGEKMRVSLVRLLATKPNLLILDEPATHLDLKGRLWLEEFLEKYAGTVVMVSHDRRLLSDCDTIWNLEDGQVTSYTGDYESFRQQYAQEQKRKLEEYEQLRQEGKSLERALQQEQTRAARSARKGRKAPDKDKFAAGKRADTASRTAGRRTRELTAQQNAVRVRLENEKPQTGVEFRFGLETDTKKGKRLVALGNVSVGYGETVVVSGVNLHIACGDRLVLLGENGVGKSTLARALARVPEVTVKGEVEADEYPAGYLDQHTRTVDSKNSVLENLATWAKDWPQQQIRDHLAKFGFRSTAEVNRSAGSLSGGERMKLALAQIAVLNPPLLVLDEPTTYLDLPSLEEVTAVVKSFPGAVVIVSHDLQFLRDVDAQHAYLVKDGGLHKLHHSPVDGEPFEVELVEKM